MQGADDATIQAIAGDYRSAPVDQQTRALLAFAHRLSREPWKITRRDWDALLAAGWSEAQCIEAVHIVGLFEYFNRVADGFGMESHGRDHPLLLEALHANPARDGTTDTDRGRAR
jgi:alkylhydroperoxidase family enzyme